MPIAKFSGVVRPPFGQHSAASSRPLTSAEQDIATIDSNYESAKEKVNTASRRAGRGGWVAAAGAVVAVLSGFATLFGIGAPSETEQHQGDSQWAKAADTQNEQKNTEIAKNVFYGSLSALGVGGAYARRHSKSRNALEAEEKKAKIELAKAQGKLSRNQA